MTLYNDTNLFNATLNDSDPRHINYTKNNEDEYVVNINQLTILHVLFECQHCWISFENPLNVVYPTIDR